MAVLVMVGFSPIFIGGCFEVPLHPFDLRCSCTAYLLVSWPCFCKLIRGSGIHLLCFWETWGGPHRDGTFLSKHLPVDSFSGEKRVR